MGFSVDAYTHTLICLRAHTHDLSVVLCRSLYLNSNGLTSLPPGVFDKNTALEYAPRPRSACLAFAEGERGELSPCGDVGRVDGSELKV